MLRLNQSTGHLCFLGAEARGTVIAVRIVEGTGALVVPRNQKWLHQLHCTAAGKVLLASMAREYFAAIKEVYELTVQTQATVTSWEKLEQDLGVVRASGFCVCKDESVFGVVSLAVPVVGGDGTVVAALSVAFSSYFLTPELQDELIGKLRQASREISAGMV
jgi:DNA-binding IclR family transcriptional regulator